MEEADEPECLFLDVTGCGPVRRTAKTPHHAHLAADCESDSKRTPHRPSSRFRGWGMGRVHPHSCSYAGSVRLPDEAELDAASFERGSSIVRSSEPSVPFYLSSRGSGPEGTGSLGTDCPVPAGNCSLSHHKPESCMCCNSKSTVWLECSVSPVR